MTKTLGFKLNEDETKDMISLYLKTTHYEKLPEKFYIDSIVPAFHMKGATIAFQLEIVDETPTDKQV
jgi:hypothetical protein